MTLDCSGAILWGCGLFALGTFGGMFITLGSLWLCRKDDEGERIFDEEHRE